MAGIGFEFNKILSKDSYAALAQAYAYAGLVGSGSWLLTMAALGLLGMVLVPYSMSEEIRLVFVSLSLIFGVSLVLVGPIQMVFTRYAADEDFKDRPENIFPAYLGCLAWVSVVGSAVGLFLFVGCVPGSLWFRISAAGVTMLIGCIWITGVLLTALKNYHSVLIGFGCGYAACVIAASLLQILYGPAGAMFGLAIGLAVLLLVLCRSIYMELGNLEMKKIHFGDYFIKYWDLALGGLLYNLGIWIDKYLYWWLDPGGEQISGILYSSTVYDRVVWFSFLTVAPGMAVFLLKLETEFSSKNQSFIQHILKKATLSQILQIKEEIIDSLRDSLGLLIKVQGACTLLLLVSEEQLLKLIHLNAVQRGVFPISLIGVFLLVIFLALLTVLYYLDKRRESLICCAVFAGVNAIATTISIYAGGQWYGAGFLCAAAAATCVSGMYVNRLLSTLDYDTFTSQSLYT